MKVEPRGKFGGVKIHLEPEECEEILSFKTPSGAHLSDNSGYSIALPFVAKMGTKIRDLMEKEPNLLQERTPEQVKAILAKEVEKAKLQLAQVEAGRSHEKVDPAVLKKALLKYVGE